MELLLTEGLFFAEQAILICDGKCSKAWGWNNRPRIELSDDPDNIVWLADGELGDAPDDPGTYEGGHAKPTTRDERHNKWCWRECERSCMVDPGGGQGMVFELEDYSQRVYNIPKPTRPTSGEEA